MKRSKHLVITTSLMLTAIGMIMIVVYEYRTKERSANGFNRAFPVLKASLIRIAPVPANPRAIAGITDRTVYLETDSANLLIGLTCDLSVSTRITLPIVINDSLQSYFKIMVDSPVVIVAGANIPVIQTTDLNGRFITSYRFPAHTFTRIVMTSPDNYVFRMFEQKDHLWNQIFAKGNTRTGITLAEHGISGKQDDAGFSSDGLLHYDKLAGLLLYCYFYRNQILCFDSLLQLKYTVPMVDQIAGEVTRGGAVIQGDEKTVTNINPTRDIHYQSCVSDGKLYVNSRAKADNEFPDEFSKNAVIDVYRTKDGRYLNSFYIPLYHGEYLKDFRVTGNKIIVLYKGLVAIYRLLQ